MKLFWVDYNKDSQITRVVETEWEKERKWIKTRKTSKGSRRNRCKTVVTKYWNTNQKNKEKEVFIKIEKWWCDNNKENEDM